MQSAADVTRGEAPCAGSGPRSAAILSLVLSGRATPGRSLRSFCTDHGRMSPELSPQGPLPSLDQSGPRRCHPGNELHAPLSLVSVVFRRVPLFVCHGTEGETQHSFLRSYGCGDTPADTF